MDPEAILFYEFRQKISKIAMLIWTLASLHSCIKSNSPKTETSNTLNGSAPYDPSLFNINFFSSFICAPEKKVGDWDKFNAARVQLTEVDEKGNMITQNTDSAEHAAGIIYSNSSRSILGSFPMSCLNEKERTLKVVVSFYNTGDGQISKHLKEIPIPCENVINYREQPPLGHVNLEISFSCPLDSNSDSISVLSITRFTDEIESQPEPAN